MKGLKFYSMCKQPVSLVDFYIHALTEQPRPLHHKHRQFLIYCKTSGQSNTIQRFTMSQFPQETSRRLITTGEELWILEKTDLYQSYLRPSHPVSCRRWDDSLLWYVSNFLHGREGCHLQVITQSSRQMFEERGRSWPYLQYPKVTANISRGIFYF